MLYLKLIKMILESSTNLYCLSYGWKLVYLLDCQSRLFWRIVIVQLCLFSVIYIGPSVVVIVCA